MAAVMEGIEMQPKDIVKQWYETRDPALFSEDVDFNVCSTFPCAGTYHGRDTVYTEFFDVLLTKFAEFRLEHDHFVESENLVFVVGRYVGRVRLKNEEFRVPFTHIWTVDSGLIIRVDQHAETGILDRAFSEAGIASS